MKHLIKALKVKKAHKLVRRVRSSYFKTVTVHWEHRPDDNVEIFVSPFSPADIKSIINSPSHNRHHLDYDYVRVLVNKHDHKVYMWDGDLVEHEYVAKALGFNMRDFEPGIAVIRGYLLNFRNWGYDHLEKYFPASMLMTKMDGDGDEDE